MYHIYAHMCACDMNVEEELREGRKGSKGGEGTSEGHSRSRKHLVLCLISKNLCVTLCANVVRHREDYLGVFGGRSPVQGRGVTDRVMGGASKKEVQ